MGINVKSAREVPSRNERKPHDHVVFSSMLAALSISWTDPFGTGDLVQNAIQSFIIHTVLPIILFVIAFLVLVFARFPIVVRLILAVVIAFIGVWLGGWLAW